MAIANPGATPIRIPVMGVCDSEPPKSVFFLMDFAAGATYEGNLTLQRQQGKIQSLRTLYFDTLNCANAVVITSPQTQWRMRFEPGKQGYRTAMISDDMQFIVTGSAPDVFRLHFANVDINPHEWPNLGDTPGSIPLASLAPASAQFNVIGRRSAGPGAWEDSTRQQLNIAGTDLANVFLQSQEITRDSIVSLTVSRHDAAIGAGRIEGQKSRGTRAAPAAVLNNDGVTNLRALAYTGATYFNNANFSFRMFEAVPGPAAMGSALSIELTPPGSTGRTEAIIFEYTNGLQLFGANTVIDANRLFRRRVYTFGTLPSPVGIAGAMAEISDGAAAPVWGAAAAGGGAVFTPVISNNVLWNNG